MASLASTSGGLKNEFVIKSLQTHIQQFEQQFSKLDAELIAYTRRCGKLRDNGDAMAHIMMDYALEVKTDNPSTSKSLQLLSRQLSAIEDHRNAEVERLAARVIEPFSGLGKECASIKNDLRKHISATKKETAEGKKLRSAQTRGTKEKTQGVKAGYDRAVEESVRTEKQLRTHVHAFEKNKLESTKKILSDFLQIELLWHVKAMELYSDAVAAVENIDTHHDLSEFSKAMNLFPLENESHQRTASSRSRSLERPHTSRSDSGVSRPAGRSLNATFNGTTRSHTALNEQHHNMSEDDDDDDGEYNDYYRHQGNHLNQTHRPA